MRNPIARYREWQTDADVYGSDLRDFFVALRNWTIAIVVFLAFLFAMAAWAIDSDTPTSAGETQELPYSDLGGVQDR